MFTSCLTCPKPTFCHQFPQEDGDRIVAFLEDALNRHRGSASAITTIWMTMLCCHGDRHLCQWNLRGRPANRLEKDNGSESSSLSVSMDSWNWDCGRWQTGFYDKMWLTRLGGHQKCPSTMIVLTSLSLRPALPGVTVGTVLPTIPWVA